MNKHSRQNGKTNALKHGFYSRFFQSLSPDDLVVLGLKLEDEIAAARLAGRQMLELAEEMDDPRQSLRALAIFSTHLTHVASLERTRAILTGNRDDTSEAITAAIEAVAREMHIL
jgi:hypothetical protein